MKKQRKGTFLAISFSFPIFVCILAFWYLTMWKIFETYVFDNVVLFLYIEHYSRVLCFCYLRSITLKIHVSGNYVLFHHIRFLHAFSPFLYITNSKLLKMHIFGIVILFFYNGCFACVLSVIYVRGSKTPKIRAFRNVAFPYRVLFTRFPVLVPKNLKNNNKKNVRFWKYCFISHDF